jgi:hypothetical protein
LPGAAEKWHFPYSGSTFSESWGSCNEGWCLSKSDIRDNIKVMPPIVYFSGFKKGVKATVVLSVIPASIIASQNGSGADCSQNHVFDQVCT